MLKINSGFIVDGQTPAVGQGAIPGSPSLQHAVGTFRRQWPIIVGAVSITLAAAVIYLFVTPARYTATVSLLIDDRKDQLSAQRAASDDQMESARVQSQVEVFRSAAVARSVIKDLHLTSDPEFIGGRGGFIDNVITMFGGGAPPSQDVLERAAIKVLSRNLIAKRVGLTLVIEISYTALDPAKAAKIANALVGAYSVVEMDARFQATKQASRWLEDRIGELREQATASARSVEEFKARNNLVNTGRGLLNEQQLTDVTSELIKARAFTAEAKARLDRISEISRGEVPDATVADALHNAVITKLRGQYLDLAARESELSGRYGVNHIAAANIRSQMKEIAHSISDELRRIGETYKSDYEIARAREQSIQKSLAGLVAEAEISKQSQVTVRDLESSAQTYRNLYESFLQRLSELTQQQTFPLTGVRVITPASQPLEKSSPRTLFTLLVSVLGGLAIGGAAALARELLDSVFRTPGQVAEILRAPCFGIIPLVKAGLRPGKSAQPREAASNRAPGLLKAEAGLARQVINDPFSRLSETMRNVKVTVDLSHPGSETRVIGVISALPGEGKTTVSANLAQLMAHTGNKTLLVDADLRNPSLSRAFAENAQEGLLDVLAGQKSFNEVLCRDAETGLDFLPALSQLKASHSAEVVSSAAMSMFLTSTCKPYRYVIIELPPIASVVDVKAASHLIDGFVLVIEWGKTSRQAVTESMQSADGVADKLLGVVLNKASPSALRRLETYKGKHHTKYYSGTYEAAP